jgi:L-alanine-DL-glutamate epimerase-like enolase superfamily enzyme
MKMTADSGEIGWGESLPREYVTETVETVVRNLRKPFFPVVGGSFQLEESLRMPSRSKSGARETRPPGPGRFDAMRRRLALLDLAGKHFRTVVSEIFGKKREWVEYSGVIGGDSPMKVAKTCLKMRLGGLRFIKIKVGGRDDEGRSDASERSWSGRPPCRRQRRMEGYRAITTIQNLKYGISSVEQPLPADDSRSPGGDQRRLDSHHG